MEKEGAGKNGGGWEELEIEDFWKSFGGNIKGVTRCRNKERLRHSCMVSDLEYPSPFFRV